MHVDFVLNTKDIILWIGGVYFALLTIWYMLTCLNVITYIRLEDGRIPFAVFFYNLVNTLTLPVYMVGGELKGFITGDTDCMLAMSTSADELDEEETPTPE